ncbi:aspartate/glutamate racemase family protein [Amphritea sp. 2_MG-2023]|uniref:aspartate/glutamate racemase family protein n=1 Tax=Amphritea TaxID=515417 RepID=UPI001C068E07|nr:MULTISPECIES: aspartate/glutamate racemase family protein [Amphritea]MBU2966049.1 aspartate/glutamate racemase family protein [Amphritea atlantica]MDO6418139.1 aspartate/glutamate racemase family protein [Amphritea sp. 2_MG-2023]
MKTIGLLGGMSWESTASYYKAINQEVKAQLGGLHSAKLAMLSVDFAEIERLQQQGDWQQAGGILAQAAQAVEAAGADFFLIGTNTMHKVAPQIEAAVSIPLLHIADATAAQLKADNITTVGLLGTRFTMEQDFYRGRLTDNHGIEVRVPDEDARQLVHNIIYDELCQGQVSDSSRQAYVDIIAELAKQGAQAVILGCTEIALLVNQADTSVPLYDTTAIHSAAAVSLALS